MPSRRPRSQIEHERASRSIPGGVNSPARAFKAVGGNPIVMAKGQGAWLTDVDGNRYLDYIGSWGPMILGHGHAKVVSAIEAALRNGVSFGAPTTLESDLAEAVVAAVPSIEMVRMVSSGTEAAMSALRLARGFTRRDLVIKFAGCYHGHVDALLVQAGSSATTMGVPSSPGVPAGCTADTLIEPFNDLKAVEAAFSRHRGRIAAVLLEPVVGNMGLVRPEPGFLEGLRELTRADGALLVFDEVMTGFRLALGGAQQLLGVEPDMTILGKILGGGLPVGAYGGRGEILSKVSPSGPVFQAGTLSGNPLAMASGLATLHELRANPPYERLERLSDRLAEGLDEAASAAGIPHSLARAGSMLTLFFNPAPVVDYESALRSDTETFARFFWKLADRGVYWPCSQFEAAFVSAAHSEEDIERTIAAAREGLAEIAAEGPTTR